MTNPPPMASTRLPDCPQWATMQWVPPSVMARLERNVRILRKLGCAAWRADVVGARILAHRLPRAEELALQLEGYRRLHAKSLRPGGRRAALMLRIPSAVSLRLDAMVAGVRGVGLAAYRHEVVGVLTLEHEPEDAAQLVASFNAYRAARVENLLAPGVSLSELLEPVPPEQGPRPR
jgi:hypothetical protein